MVKTTIPVDEFLRDTFEVDATRSDGKDLTIRDGNVDYCAKTIDDHSFAMGTKSALEKYSEMRASSDKKSRLLEVVKDLRDGDVFVAIDISTIDKAYGANTQKENNVRHVTNQFIRSIASSTQFMAVSVDYNECIEAQVSLYAVDAQRQKSIKETIVALEKYLDIVDSGKPRCGDAERSGSVNLFAGKESLEIENAMNFETRISLELNYDLIDLVYSKNLIMIGGVQE